MQSMFTPEQTDDQGGHPGNMHPTSHSDLQPSNHTDVQSAGSQKDVHTTPPGHRADSMQTTEVDPPARRGSRASVYLCNRTLWTHFHRNNTEMIITKQGRYVTIIN